MINRIGILGGPGFRSMVYFLQQLNRAYLDIGQPDSRQGFPDLTIILENSLPELTGQTENDYHPAGQRINRAIAGMILSGCDPVVIPSIAFHSLVEQRWFDAGVIDCRKLIIDHYEAIDTGAIAVLAADGVISSDVFAPLQDHFDLYYPPDSHQRRIMSTIDDLHHMSTADVGIEGGRSAIERIIMTCQQQGIEYFLAGDADLEAFIADLGIDAGFIMPMALLSGDVVELLLKGTVTSPNS